MHNYMHICAVALTTQLGIGQGSRNLIKKIGKLTQSRIYVPFQGSLSSAMKAKQAVLIYVVLHKSFNHGESLNNMIISLNRNYVCSGAVRISPSHQRTPGSSYCFNYRNGRVMILLTELHDRYNEF